VSNTTVSLVILALLCGGAVAGKLLRAALPGHHVDDASKGTVLLGTGLVVTMSALVLGLLVGSANSSFDAQREDVAQMSARVVLLDRALAYYGPEAKEARDVLRTLATRAAETIASQQTAPPPIRAEGLFNRIMQLSPKDDAQRASRQEALQLLTQIDQTRWLAYEQRRTPFPRPLLVVVVGWLTLVFVSFGLFAPANGTVAASLFLTALSVSGAVLLILELYSPYTGLIRVSAEPVRAAVEQLGK